MKKNYYFEGAEKITFTRLINMGPEQDGAIYNGYVFRLDHAAACRVLSLETGELLCSFTLGDKEFIYPHSNAVFFGNEKLDDNDEFPILYSNVYNTYAKAENRREGTLCAYRIKRNGNDFSAELVQIIAIDFVKDTSLWLSPNVQDYRPYGNFVLDKENNIIYAFVMRDEARKTAFFAFNMPKLSDGKDIGYKEVKEVRLKKEDILDKFESDYINFMQGATFYNGYIYSVEGFDVVSPTAKPVIKIFDVKKKTVALAVNLWEHGFNIEPEFVEAYNGAIYYADRHPGDLYLMEFAD